MTISKEIDILTNEWWSGAEDTVERCEQEGKGDELVQLVEEHFDGTTPDETDVNDFLRFEDDYIFESLGIYDDEDEDEDSDEEDEDEE